MIRRAFAAGALLLAAPLAAAEPAPPAIAIAAGERWEFDQIRFPIPADPAAQKRIFAAIGPDHSLAAVETTLRRLGVEFERSGATLDPTQLPETARAQLLASQTTGEPIALPSGGMVTISVLVARGVPTDPIEPVPAVLDAARLDAARALIEVMLPAAEREQIFAGMIDAVMQAQVAGLLKAQPGFAEGIARYPAAGQAFGRFVARQRGLALEDLRATTPQFVNAQVQAIARHFTTAELVRLTELFSQPLARKYLREAPKLVGEPEMAAWQQQMAARAQGRLQAELQQLQDEMKAAMPTQGRTNAS